MKTRIAIRQMAAMLVALFALLILPSARAGTTIDSVNRHAYGANLGWMDAVADTNNGAVIGEYICSGYIYAANVGWISLGGGAPADGIYYQNNSATDWGVNQDGLGNLSGYAWGANIGWITFEQTDGKPKINLLTGQLSGYAWSANCGWISLSNAMAYVQTDKIAPGADTDGDGIPDAWELQHFGNLSAADGASDTDGDGVSDKNEYLASTDPGDPNDYLHITSLTHGTPAPASTTLQWTSVASRLYVVQERPSLTGGAWADYISDPALGWNNVDFDDSNSTNEFFRVRAYRPLMP